MIERAQAAQVGDTGEQQILEEAAVGLREWARRLPEGSAWRETLTLVAQKVEAGAEASLMLRQSRRAA